MKMISFLPLISALAFNAALAQQTGGAPAQPTPTGNGAIFFHPDGTSAGHWDAVRLLNHGPDGSLNWDALSEVAPYRGHLADQLTGTSNAGAVTHATGTRAYSGSFGLDEEGSEYTSADGTTNTLMETAVTAGLGTALVQSGSLIEPGSAAFVAEAASRNDLEEIALEVVESGVDVMLGAGEEWLLPEGTEGRFGAGARTDGRNLIRELENSGYRVVYTRDELLNLPADAGRVFGVFNVEDTFYDRPEEELRAEGLPNYLESAPTVGEMIDFALSRISDNENGFLLVAEEEGTDNFCNNGNASGCLEALGRADAAFGTIATFIEQNPDTFMVTTSDSNAGGMQIVDATDEEGEPFERVPATAESGAPLDGINGTNTAPFTAAPDAQGNRYPFAVAWSSYADDLGSGVIARAHGLNAAELVPPSGIANTDIYRVLYRTLFGDLPDGDQAASR